MAITSGKHPYQVALHLSAVTAAVAMVASGNVPRSAEQVMAGPVLVMWVALLVLSGLAGAVMVWWPSRWTLVTALRVELGGVFLLAGGASMYAIALFATAGLQAVVAGGFVSGLAVGSWWRSAQILRDVRRVSEMRAKDDGG
ncbi:hypothetical protein ACIBCR_15165 [Micromonospora echinospora]|uniref:hypothetical protein n=1 Tax=Micromonospora echinospora TaxID=1877 RepID=UPI0037969C26